MILWREKCPPFGQKSIFLADSWNFFYARTGQLRLVGQIMAKPKFLKSCFLVRKKSFFAIPYTPVEGEKWIFWVRSMNVVYSLMWRRGQKHPFNPRPKFWKTDFFHSNMWLYENYTTYHCIHYIVKFRQISRIWFHFKVNI